MRRCYGKICDLFRLPRVEIAIKIETLSPTTQPLASAEDKPEHRHRVSRKTEHESSFLIEKQSVFSSVICQLSVAALLRRLPIISSYPLPREMQ